MTNNITDHSKKKAIRKDRGASGVEIKIQKKVRRRFDKWEIAQGCELITEIVSLPCTNGRLF